MAKAQSKITFGSVTVTSDVPSKTEIKKNVKEGKDILLRLFEKLQKPGVNIRFKDNIPYYHADPDNPDRLIRNLNGKKEFVALENGELMVCE